MAIIENLKVVWQLKGWCNVNDLITDFYLKVKRKIERQVDSFDGRDRPWQIVLSQSAQV